MLDQPLQVRVDAPSGTIILKRPDRRNALSRDLVNRLRQALSDLHQEKSVRAVILTGTGDVFCAGTDLHEIQSTSATDDSQLQWQKDASQFRQLLEQMLQFPKPIIAALNGPAIGSGTALVLAADLVLGTSSSSFCVPEVKRGLVGGWTAPLLAFRVGAGHAARLLLTAMEMDAEQAHRIGLYQEIVPHDMIWVRANELAQTVAQSSHEAVTSTKRLLNETVGDAIRTQLFSAAAATASARTTAAAAEGVAAFLEKRAPEWP